jgi:hypothetical protein
MMLWNRSEDSLGDFFSCLDIASKPTTSNCKTQYGHRITHSINENKTLVYMSSVFSSIFCLSLYCFIIKFLYRRIIQLVLNAMKDTDKYIIDLLLNEKLQLLERVSAIDTHIALLTDGNITKPIDIRSAISHSNLKPNVHTGENGFKKDWTNKNKVAYIIKKANRFLHSREISSQLQEIDDSFDKSKIGEQVSTALYQMKDMPDYNIIGIRIGKSSNQGTVWGSKKWVDSEGNILPEYAISEEAAKSTKSEVIGL